MKTLGAVFNLRLRFDISCMASQRERKVLRIDEVCDRSMCYIRIILEDYLTCSTNYPVSEAEDTEEMFRIILELSDDMHRKADLLYFCAGDFMLRTILRDTKEDTDKCILAFESAVHLTQGHSEKSTRLIMLGALLCQRFKFMGDPTDISKAILYQQEALHLIPEGHEGMPHLLRELGTSLLLRFQFTGDNADISKAMSYQKRAIHLTPESHANMPLLLNNLGTSFRSRFETTGDSADLSDAMSYQQKQFISLLRAMKICPSC